MAGIWYLEQAAREYLAREQWIHGVVHRVNIGVPQFPFSKHALQMISTVSREILSCFFFLFLRSIDRNIRASINIICLN